MAHTQTSFGREVLGPVFAEFAQRLWLYLSSLEAEEETALLFCARGGLRLQLLYERFLAACGLASPVHAAGLMVSRVVAVRPALLAGAESAFEQIGYEFGGSSLRDVAAAVSGLERATLDGAAWRAPYSREGLRALLEGDGGRVVREAIGLQAERFARHLALQSGGRGRIVLCDTGLFGSTLQLLADGMPALSWSAVMVARANYKHQPAPHFSRTVGLSVEADQYCPWDRRTSVLRYWQLIESIFEPDLASVTGFGDVDGVPVANLEVAGWQARVLPEPGSLYAGIIDHVDGLAPGDALRVVAEAQTAWKVLHRALAWPGRNEAEILDAGARSDDFGRTTPALVARPWQGPLAALRGRSMWREGEIARATSLLRMPMLLGIETAYGLRWCRGHLRRT